MAETPESVVKRLLRSSEDVKIALEAHRPADAQIDADDATTDVPGSYGQRRQPQDSVATRIVAVVVHLDSSTGDEQACLFCVSQRKFRSSGEPGYAVERVFPIVDGFSIAMAQSGRNTLDLSSPPKPAVLTQPHTDLTLTVHADYDSTAEPLILVTRDTERLRSLLSECRRLRDTSVANLEPAEKPVYGWILPYTSRPGPTILSRVPRDLRHTVRPAHELLADVCAGTSTPANDVFDISVLREGWIRSRIQQHCCAVASEGQQTSLRLRIGTFNVNGKLPSQDLSAWVQSRSRLPNVLPPIEELSPFNLEKLTQNPLDTTQEDVSNVPEEGDESDDTKSAGRGANASSESLKPDSVPARSDDLPDLIVLGFQELDLSAGALLYSTETTREDAWYTAIMAGLGEKAERYEKLASKQLVGMLLVIIVKRQLRSCFTQAQTSSAGAGILGLMGNKGGTAIRLTFTPVPTSQASKPRSVVLTFVNTHLAAFDESYEKRNADFHDLSKRLTFDSGVPTHEHEDQTTRAAASPPTVPLNVYQTDVLFWLGDLNYRINLPDSDIRTLLAHEQHRPLNLPVLLKHDQLNLALQMRKAFVHFREHPIKHIPSYRFNADALSDSLGYDLKRKPAWTDRILHMCTYAARVQQLSYSFHPEITMSDHRPVSADFAVHVPIVDADELDQFVHHQWTDVSNMEHSENDPQIEVQPPSIDFGSIGYNRLTRKILRVNNVGKVASTFRLVPLTPATSIHPTWMQIHPMSGLVLPGEHVEVVLSVNVGRQAAVALNLGEAHLECLLILHTPLGKDHFVSVDGTWERTCFGIGLERLNRLAGPVRAPSEPELLPVDQAATAPKELLRLVGWLMANAADVDDLFLAGGDDELMSNIRECLDTGAELPDASEDKRSKVGLSLSVAQCLLQLLDSLPDALAPTSLHARCATVADRDEAFELLNDFPSAAVNAWIAVTSLLHYICQHNTSERDSGRAENLAAVFAPILFRDSISDSAAVLSPVGKRRFVKCFIA